ncbi:DNA-directed RNA polymerase I subunit RPA2 [Pancytospora philotis]|nr:DNA-directed RNA polymerase I subunit RPA2 [Pancytospora philotis]
MRSKDIGDQHVRQFDALFGNGILSNVIAKTNPMAFKKFKLVFEEFEVHQPYWPDGAMLDRRLLPRDCREQSLTYGGACFLKVRLEYDGRVLFSGFKPAGVFPVMLRSSLCHLRALADSAAPGDLHRVSEDPDEAGGYFIVGGYDKMVRFHIAYKRNHMFVVKAKSKDAMYTDFSCMIRSVGEDEVGQKNEIKYCADGNILYKMYVHKRIYLIPVVLILRALVNTTDEEIYRSIGADKRVLTLLARMREIDAYSQREALGYLGNRFRPVMREEDPVACGRELLRRYVLIHLNSNEDKFNLIVDSIRKLLRCVDGEIAPDNIDLTSNHELYTEAQLIALCVREKLEEIKRAFYIKILSIVRPRINTGESTTSLNASEAAELLDTLSEAQVERAIKFFNALDFSVGSKVSSFLSTGNLTTMSCSDLLQTSGFTIIAERINFWRFASHFESVSRGAFFATLKITSIRKLRPESWGFLCPVHTPDGAPCGLLLHLTKNCHITAVPAAFDPAVCFEHGLVPAKRLAGAGVPLYYNGKLLGRTEGPRELVTALRRHRSEHRLCVEIAYEHGPLVYEAVYVSDGMSALMRRVRNLRTGEDDWIGAKEQIFLDIQLAKYATDDAYNDCDRACADASYATSAHDSVTVSPPTVGHEYAEIECSNMFSTVGACIPFADYNPSPRNIYQCQMAKQAMGVPAYNMRTRTDNKMYWVNYLQTPMVHTDAYSALAKYPIGYNCVVAVLSYTAYDMEDAVVINKSAKERGLFSAYIYKNEKFVLAKNAFIEYTPSVGTVVKTDDVLVSYSNEDTGPGAHKYTGAETGVVECVRVFTNGTPCVTVTIRIERNPTIGDKFCSRHGQKGVLSMLWPEVDMPFTEQGLRPDLIINPHAFPSRMTIGMLLESMCGKAAMVTGEEQDATPFVKNTYFKEDETAGAAGASQRRNIGEELEACGFNYYGNEPMYSGITGTEFKTDIFIGSVYYQRLRHMVNDKYQVRTSGAVVATTRQPVGGRKNKGGIRFGEMERDALIAHGVSCMLKDRLLDCSDRAEFYCCTACSSILFANAQGCGCGGKQVRRMVLPYVFKYLCSELLAMNIRVKVEL